MFRVGLGQDSHKFGETEVDKPLILGGVTIPDGPKVNEANSDGDVILHAVCNALSQAVGGPSLGVFADPMAREGIEDSTEYIKYTMEMVKSKGYRVNNVGIMVEAKTPRLEGYSSLIKDSIAQLLGLSKDDVGVTFTSGEGLTSFGCGIGIQAFVIASLIKDE